MRQVASNPSRRKFLKNSVQSAALLTVSFNLPIDNARASETGNITSTGVTPNAWLTINSDNTVTILSSAAEMGQGSFTSLPMMIAEELELLVSQVKIEHAPANPVFANRIFNFQATGGSTSVRWAFDPLRQIGADIRELLKNAAAEKWQTDASRLSARAAVVHHPDGHSATYAELAESATKLPMPAGTALKPRAKWRILGTEFKRKDTPVKINGTAKFGVDVQLEGMLVATIKACPVLGGTLESVDTGPAMVIKGVKSVVKLEDAIAVCATDYWAAKKGLDALEPKWSFGANANLSTETIRARLLENLEHADTIGLNTGDIDAIRKATEKVHSVVYEAPYLAHATMEPMNATVDATQEIVKVWAPAQTLARVQLNVASALQISPDKVDVQGTFMGGGFGRRGTVDFAVQAALISKQAQKPVKLIWSREEDMTQGFYRPMTITRMTSHLDNSGKTRCLEIHSACQSIARRGFPGAVSDKTITEGLADSDYVFDASFMGYNMTDIDVPITYWRSVGYSQNSWIMESFVDELAELEGKDPYQWRYDKLTSSARKRNVLEIAAKQAGWGSPKKGHTQGIAIVHSYGSTVAQILEVKVSKNKKVKINKITCVVDCGLAINPDSVRAQMESSIVYGLTAAMYGEITIENGAVEQTNFHQYEMMRLRDMPVVNVHIVESTGIPGGIGEPGLPPVAPALCNAIYATTGNRIHKLPLSKQGFSFG